MLRATAFACLAVLAVLTSCQTAPKAEDKADFVARAQSSTTWFERNVAGLGGQIDNSGGYIIFPDIIQYGILFGGGTWGRGALCEPDGTQVGWAAINRGSVGLQAGVQGFRMLIVLRDEATMNLFKRNQLGGSVGAVAVIAEEGGSATAKFEKGVAVYEGASKGLMAGVDIGLDYIRYEPMTADETPADFR